MNPIFLYIYTLILFVVFDIAWFYFYSYKKIYKPQFKKLNNNSNFVIRKIGAGITYLILSLGLFLFLYYCKRNNKKQRVFKNFILGVLFGLVVYGTYNGTNYSTIEKYELKTAITDTVWGCIVCGVISVFVSFSMK
jgi:uncharacterized membrane protein